MDTTKILITVAAVIVLGGIGWVAVSQMSTEDSATKEDAMMDKTSDATMAGDSMMEKSDDSMMETGSEAMIKDDGAMMEGDPVEKEDGMMKEEGAMMQQGTYEPYAAEKLAMASASHDVVLFFRASWCPTCKAVDADIKANLSKIPGSLTILDVNYDNSTALKQKYGVTYQHTFVQVDAAGNLIKKWSGSPTLAALVAEVK